MSFRTFFHAVHDFFVKLGHSTSWEKAVSNTIAIAAPLTEELVALTAGEPAAAEVQSIVTQVQNDLSIVKGVVDGAQTGATGSPALMSTVTSSLNSVKSNLGALLTAGHVKNPETLTKVTATANTIIGEVEAILGAIPVAATA